MTRNFGMAALLIFGCLVQGAFSEVCYEFAHQDGWRDGFAQADPAGQYMEGLCDGLRMTRVGKPDLPDCIGVPSVRGPKK